MKTPNAIPILLVCLLAVLAEGANTSLTNSHARRSIERNHHNHQRYAHSGGRRLDGSYIASELRRNEEKRLVDDVVKLVDAAGLPLSGTDTATSSSATDTTSSTASSTDSASSTSVTDTASSTSVSTTDSATSTVSSTSSASSSASTDSTSASDSATSTESATSTVSSTDSATSTESVSDSATATVSDPPPTSASDSATATVTDPPPTSASDSATATVTDPPATTPTVSDPPASSTKTECDPLDIVCIGSTILFPSSTPTSDSQVSTPAPTSDTPQTDSSSATATVSDPPQTDSSSATATVSDPPSSTSDIVSDIVNTLSSLLPTDTATRTFSDLPTQTDSATQSDRPTDTVSQSDTFTQSDKPTDTQTQSDQPTQTDTSSGTQTISQPPPTITDSFSVTDSYSNTNTRTITGSDSPTDSATESATRTESVSFPTLTDSPTDSQPTATATDSSASDSITDSVSMTMTTEPIPSEYSYITDQSLALTSLPATSTLALTLTDPDAAFTTASLTQSGTNAPSQAVAFPTQLPTRIFPANRLDPNDPSLDGMVLVSLKFLSSLTWAFVVNNSNTAALLFVYTPQTVANALGISQDQVKTFAMQAFSPADWNGDISQLSTVYLLYIPADQVDALQQQLLVQNSPLYTNQAGIPKQISQQLDATFPVNAVGLDTTIVGTGNTGNGNSGAADASAASRRDAIIGVCAAFGVILLAVVAWWVYKSWKRRQDRAHRRLTHDSAGMHQAGGYGATTQTAYGTVYGAAPQRSGYAQPHTPMYNTSGAPIANPFEDSSYEEDPDERRRSFFYAEDSLRGFSVPREEDQGITYTQLRNQQQGLMPNDGKRRAPIQASAISAPILRESSLNW